MLTAEMNVSYQIKLLYIATGSLLRKKVARLGISSTESQAMHRIWKWGKPHLLQSDLRRELDVSGATLSKTLEGLEKKGLIRRELYAKDPRVKEIIVTPMGAALEAEHAKIMREVQAIQQRGFSEAEMSLMNQWLITMKRNIDAAHEREPGAA